MSHQRAILVSVVLAAATLGHAQYVRRGRGNAPVNPTVQRALQALQNDLASAIRTMESALPIYDGNRVKSIHAAHRALAMVDRVLYGKNAVTRPASKATDTVASSAARKQYSSAQIGTSQQAMKTALGYLQSANSDLQAAEGNTPNGKGAEESQHIAKAISEAQTAISLHGG